MHQLPFGSVPVLHPDLFQMDKSALPGTEEIMLQGSKLEEIGFLIHEWLSVIFQKEN